MADKIRTLQEEADWNTARALRLAVVQREYNDGNLTEGEARQLLSGPLTPGDDSTIVDDSGELKVTIDVQDSKT